MKVIITADIHNGVPKKTDDCIWAMEVIRRYAHEHDIIKILVLGDLFHDRVNLNIEMWNKVCRFFDKTNKEFNQTWICFPGNHDMFLKNSWSINSLSPMHKFLEIIEDVAVLTIGESRFWIVPFIHYESVYMKVIDEICESHQKDDVLLTHIGITGAKWNECFLLKNWGQVSFADTPFDRVYSGHFHCHQQVGKNAWYPGSPIPFRFDEGLVEHGFFVYDLDTRTHEFVPIYHEAKEDSRRPPDYITITDDDVESFDNADGNNVKIILTKEHTKNDVLELRKTIESKGAINVNVMEQKEKDIDIKEEQSKIGMLSVDKMFESWVDFDKPKDMSHKLLFKLNSQVIQGASERIVIESAEDD